MCDNKKTCKNKMGDILQNALNSIDKPTVDKSKCCEVERCAVTTCENTENCENLHGFPNNLELCNIWIDRCGIDIQHITTENLRICSSHFAMEDFEEDSGSSHRKNLKSNAVPSRNLSNSSPDQSIKEYLDENEILQSKITKLRDERLKIKQEIKTYNKSIKMKQRKCLILKNKIDKFRHSSSAMGEKNILLKVFSHAQIKILLGKRNVCWSDDDLAMAFSLRQMSSKECYLYLKRFLNFPLPSLSCVQRWAASQ